MVGYAPRAVGWLLPSGAGFFTGKHSMPFKNADFAHRPEFSVMIGPTPPAYFESNGASYAPDVILGTDIRPAAHFHDFAYSAFCPGTNSEQRRYERDRDFLVNLRTCGLIWPIAFLYYSRVRLWGHWALPNA